jgi:REP element-mobilizing transposase RayT
VQEPLAYFLTWRTYGTRLHGDDHGSVDRHHNVAGAPLLPPEPAYVERNRMRMRDGPVTLDLEQRRAVDSAIRERCRLAGWKLLALNVRTNHVHVVVGASELPEQVMVSLKAWATRRLRECELAPRGRTWARHGSTRYVWDEEGLENVCIYVTDLQDVPRS